MCIRDRLERQKVYVVMYKEVKNKIKQDMEKHIIPRSCMVLKLGWQKIFSQYIGRIGHLMPPGRKYMMPEVAKSNMTCQENRLMRK